MKPDQKKNEKRLAIIEAARKEFASNRYGAVKLNDIADAAGVGKGTLYLYFKNKEDLFAQMALSGVEEIIDKINTFAEMESDYYQRLLDLCEELKLFVHRRIFIFQAMKELSSEKFKIKFLNQNRDLANAARKFLKSGVDEGILRDDVTLADLHCFLIGPLIAHVHLNKLHGDDIKVGTLIDMFWKAATK